MCAVPQRTAIIVKIRNIGDGAVFGCKLIGRFPACDVSFELCYAFSDFCKLFFRQLYAEIEHHLQIVINAEIYILVKIRFEKHTVTDAAEKPFGRFIVISVGYYRTVQHKVAMSYRAYSVGADVDKNVYIGGVGAFFVTLLVLQFFNIYLTGIKSLGIAAQGFQRYERGYDLRK